MTLGFLLLALGNFFFFEGIRAVNFISLMIGAAMMILISLLFFKSRFDNLDENLLNSWQFWVATGLLLYFTGTLFYFGLIKYLNDLSMEWAMRLNSILQFMNIVMYTIFGIALLCLTRRQKLFR